MKLPINSPISEELKAEIRAAILARINEMGPQQMYQIKNAVRNSSKSITNERIKWQVYAMRDEGLIAWDGKRYGPKID